MADCMHKCHQEPGLNPWVKVCPVCGCPNTKYDPDAKVPDWLVNFMNQDVTHG